MVSTTRKSDRGEFTGHSKMQRVIVQLDYFVFVKNGYSVWMHLIPFAIASLLLLTLSLPEGNLLLNLVEVLQQPSWIWLPAGLLTAVAAVIYFFTIKAQVRRAYLWSDGDFRRTVCTSLVYVILCTLMVYAVLMSISSYKITFGTILACLLVAVLSLTGIGWKISHSWIDSTDTKSPDYTEGRASAEKLTGILGAFRGTKENRVTKGREIADEKDVEDFLDAVKTLRSNIKENLQIEPEWAKYELEEAKKALLILLNEININFSSNEEDKYFAAACQCQMEYKYKNFIEHLNTLGTYWHQWKCSN